MDFGWREELLKLRDQYCTATGIASATVAHKAAGDGDFFDRLQEGKGCGVDKYLAVKKWLTENMPLQSDGKKKNGHHNGSSEHG